MKALKIHFLNTIWSDAILIESNNRYAFIDTGSSFYYPMIEKVTVDFNHTMHIVIDIYFSMQQIKKIIFVGEINH